jgi:hypothetical protein
METILKRSKSAILSAIVKNGISMFKLEILEYCSGRRSHPTEKCVKIEQRYFNLFKPEYNILQIAGSRLVIHIQ